MVLVPYIRVEKRRQTTNFPERVNLKEAVRGVEMTSDDKRFSKKGLPCLFLC